MSGPKIVFLNRVYPPQRGASGRVLRDLARAMVKKGWDVTVVCTGKSSATEQDGQVKVERVGADVKTKNAVSYLWAWIKILMRARSLEKPDLVITMTDPPMLVIAGDIVARRKKCAHMHWLQDLYPDVLPSLGKTLPDWLMGILQGMSEKALRRCDRVVVIGRCMAKQITQKGVEKSKISMITNWPDPELFELNDTASKKGKTAKSLPVKEGAIKNFRPYAEQKKEKIERKFRVLYAGTLGQAHPIATILDAAERLQDEFDDIELVFMGEGSLYKRLAEERAKRSLENIKLLPWQPIEKFRDVMESGDVHLVTMQHEASGMIVPCKFYAAMAVGRPCVFIGPEDSEVAQTIKDFKAGYVVPQGDAEKLADVIKSLRMSGEDWFSAHEGALEAGKVFLPEQSLDAWIKRAETVIHDEKQKEFAA